VVYKFRSETLKFNDERIEAPKDEIEVWIILNNVLNPNKINNQKITNQNGVTENESEIADAFNLFFVEEIEKRI
jgi:hypothetical protein